MISQYTPVMFARRLKSEVEWRPSDAASKKTAPTTGTRATLPYFIGFSQASVTALSMMCRSILLHLGQLKVRKSWPNALGSIAVSFIGELQATQHGPWFCESSMGRFAEEAEADCDAGMRFPFRWPGALHSQSPMDAEAGRMQPACSPGLRSHWSILLTFEKLTNDDAGDHDLVSKPNQRNGPSAGAG